MFERIANNIGDEVVELGELNDVEVLVEVVLQEGVRIHKVNKLSVVSSAPFTICSQNSMSSSSGRIKGAFGKLKFGELGSEVDDRIDEVHVLEWATAHAVSLSAKHNVFVH